MRFFLPLLLACGAFAGESALKPGAPLPPFSLRGVDGKVLDSKTLKGPVLVTFLSVQCPYVKATEGRINALAKAYAGRVAFVGINANESESAHLRVETLEGMKARAAASGYAFPYVKDEAQTVVKAFGALCTPDFFLFDAQGKLAYHGRLDDGGGRPEDVKRQELKEALDAVLAGRPVVGEPKASMGCSIKWKK
ncbi:MAG TPA: thioredoxin family protein [Holophagaceae bacterium]|nr:thioredoxin family protein [Holophagaceae bacterium]